MRLRQGELLALRWRDIDWPARRVRIRRNFVRGGGYAPPSHLTSTASRRQETPSRSSIGLTRERVADSAIVLTSQELQAFGLQKGPSSKHGGYAGRAHYELST